MFIYPRIGSNAPFTLQSNTIQEQLVPAHTTTRTDSDSTRGPRVLLPKIALRYQMAGLVSSARNDGVSAYSTARMYPHFICVGILKTSLPRGINVIDVKRACVCLDAYVFGATDRVGIHYTQGQKIIFHTASSPR